MPKAMSGKSRPSLLISATAIWSFLYIAACFVVFQNSDFIEGMRGKTVSNSMAKRSLKALNRHSGTFYREVADRLQFYSHDPELVGELYTNALKKAPADYKIVSSHAYYLASRECCQDKVVTLLEEALKRYPNNSKIHRFSATYLLSIDRLQNAVPHFRRAIELEPHSAQELYKLLELKGNGLQTLAEITPNQSDAKLQFAFYLSAKGNGVKKELKHVLDFLAKLSLKPEQRLATAELALRAGWIQLAEEQASLLNSSESRVKAFQLLADIALQQKKWSEFQKQSLQVERFYLQMGDRDKAANSALEAVTRLGPAKGKSETKKGLLKVLKDYPHYAPAYEQMANFSQNESEQVALYYWKKAVELAPERWEYKDRLARHYLNLSRIIEAEAIYKELSLTPEARKLGYLGLSRCSLARNDPMQAITILEHGLQQSAESAELYFELGKIFESIRDYERAAGSYKEFSRLVPENTEGYILAAEAYRNMGDFRAAREQYQQLLKRDPENLQAREALLLLNSM